MNYEIGKRVRKIRLQKGISQEQFGELIGIKKAAVSKIENGDNSLSRSNLISICKQFNINNSILMKNGYYTEKVKCLFLHLEKMRFEHSLKMPCRLILI